jgi:histidinol-phosphate aminotransferase
LYTLNDKLKNLQPYTVDTTVYDVRLDANESFITPPPEVIGDVSEAIARVGLNRYPNPSAAEFCAAYADLYGIDADKLTIGNGSDELLSVIISSFLQRGQKMMVVTPDFSMYAFYARLAECQVCEFRKGSDLRIDVDALIGEVNTQNCNMLVFSNPCNPTSLGLCRDDVRKIIRSVSALVVLDEAYMDFWDQSLIAEASDYDNLILLRTCSKMIGLAAMRLGIAVANPTITSALHAAKSPYNVNSLSQAAGTAVMRHKDYIEACKNQIIQSTDALYKALCKLGSIKGFTVFPTCTNFVLLKLSNAVEIFEKLKEHSILVRCFGDYLRITAGTESENSRLLSAMYEIL